MNLEWMAWTPITAGFFITIFIMLVGMGIWQVISPTVARRGLIPLVTTRGDRFFHRAARQRLHHHRLDRSYRCVFVVFAHFIHFVPGVDHTLWLEHINLEKV